MKHNFRQLYLMLRHSKQLEEKHKAELLTIFLYADDRDLKQTVEFLQERPARIKLLLDNYLTKKKAFKEKDPVVWQQVLQHQIEVLKQEY